MNAQQCDKCIQIWMMLDELYTQQKIAIDAPDTNNPASISALATMRLQSLFWQIDFGLKQKLKP